MTVLIGFAGQKGAGKDTAAQALEGFENVKLAGALKVMLTALLAYQGCPDCDIHRFIEGDLKEAPCEYLGGRTPRHAMQTLGTEWGRDLIAPTLWVDATERRIAQFPRAVVTDVRFPNEVAMVRRLGGQVFRIVRPNGAGLDDPHPSEAQIATLPVDGEIVNDFAHALDFSFHVFDRVCQPGFCARCNNGGSYYEGTTSRYCDCPAGQNAKAEGRS